MTVKESVGATCMSWWANNVNADTGSARRSRAELRRAGSTTAALSLAATHELNRRMVDAGHDLRKRKDGPERLALIAVTLANVMRHRTESAATRFGHGDPKALNGIRFEALIRSETPSQIMRPLARSLRLVDGAVNVAKLASDLYWWNEKVRTDWCFDYHGAADAKPTPKEESA